MLALFIIESRECTKGLSSDEYQISNVGVAGSVRFEGDDVVNKPGQPDLISTMLVIAKNPSIPAFWNTPPRWIDYVIQSRGCEANHYQDCPTSALAIPLSVTAVSKQRHHRSSSVKRVS